MPDALLFDFGGTLDADGIPWKERFQAICDVTDREFYDADDALIGTMPKSAGLRDILIGLGTPASRRLEWRRLAAGAEDAGVPIEIFEREAVAHLRENAALLRHWHQRYRIAIVSNFYGNLEAVCREHGIEADAYIDSFEVGCSKPDPRIFLAALDALGVHAKDALFIGDSPHRDMAGARALGMPHVLVSPGAVDGCCDGDRIVRRVGDLVLAGGIIAAGEGSRLRGAGVPKPLVEVNGVPLIEHVIRNFDAAGIDRLVVVFNEAEEDCRDFVRARFPDVEVILKTTASSLETFRVVTDALGERAVISTVDAICPPRDFVGFVRAAERRSGAVLALTPFVDDERPLWATVAPGGRITTIGGSSGNAVTAGMYVVPAPLPFDGEYDRLRHYLGALVASGTAVHGEMIEKVIDVDRPEDVLVAERSL